MNPGLILLIVISSIIAGILFTIKTPKGRGIIGELKVKLVLGKTKEGKKYVFNNYMLTFEGKSSQIDHILVNQSGVFVIETKNYSGRIYGNENQHEWTQVLNYGKVKNRLYNPVKQNATHVYRLKKLLPNLPYVNSVIVFVQNNTKYIQAESVIPLSHLKRLIKERDKLLTAEEMVKINNDLLSVKSECNISDKEHILEIYEIKENIKNNICPRCGGKLVERNGKYGVFYGCENYPQCKFIKKN